MGVGKRRKTRGLSLAEFLDRCGTERQCRDTLVARRWPNGFVCPRCGHTKAYPRSLTQKDCARCKYRASVTAGTVLHKTHLPLTTWFLAMYLEAESKRGISALELSRKLGLRYETAWFVLRRLRSAMGQREAMYLLNGTVDVDDVFVGGITPGRRGRGTRQVPCVMALSLNANNNPEFLKIMPVDGWDTASVTQRVKEMVAVEASIATDAMGGFRGLRAAGYEHFMTVSAHLPEGEYFSPCLHTQIANLKAQLHGTYHRTPKRCYISSYFDAFCFRFNRRFLSVSVMDRLVTACAVSTPLSATVSP